MQRDVEGSDHKSSPLISVIIPAYNTAPFIGETLLSVVRQTFTDFEIIVVNDGSPDTPALEEALAPFATRIRYMVQENRGLSGARNAGIAVARGEFVAFLDSDDAWESDYLECQLAELRSRGLAVVYANATTFGDPLRSGRLFMDMHPSSGEVTIESLVAQTCNVMVSVLARREALVKAGLFDESLRSSEDFDLWLRVIKSGGTIGYHRKPLVRSRLHRGSLSANGVSMCQHIVRVLDKTAKEMTLTPAERELIARRRGDFAALQLLHEGRRAFFAGAFTEATEALTEANKVLRRRKLAIALPLLRLMPGVLLRAYDLRDRLVFRTLTR